MEHAGPHFLVAGLLLVMTLLMAYFVYLVHFLVERQRRLERYLVTSARILSMCVGGMALPPIVQKITSMFTHVHRCDDARDAEWWAHLHRMSQQAAAHPPAAH